MIPTSVMAIFCEDIREEKAGGFTLVGVTGDNIVFPAAPDEKSTLVGLIPRIAIYFRMNFDVAAEINHVALKITMPDGTVVDAGDISQVTLKDAQRTGGVMAGVVTRLLFGPIPLRKLGRMTVEAVIDGQPYLAGFLNFQTEGQIKA